MMPRHARQRTNAWKVLPCGTSVNSIWQTETVTVALGVPVGGSGTGVLEGVTVIVGVPVGDIGVTGGVLVYVGVRVCVRVAVGGG